jgi:hypothetical protein
MGSKRGDVALHIERLIFILRLIWDLIKTFHCLKARKNPRRAQWIVVLYPPGSNLLCYGLPSGWAAIKLIIFVIVV